MRFQAPRGTEDVVPNESRTWVWLEQTFRELCYRYGYSEVRTPTFEDTGLFTRGLGEGTDIVNKEMYTFVDRGGRSITLKPEGTAPAIRAYVEHSLGSQGQITKLFYVTPIFRYERPQKGRLREAHQTGLELIGAQTPESDAEVIEMSVRFYEMLGLRNLAARINSLGSNESRKIYREALLEHARPLLADLPTEFRERCEKNPLRILDSKDETLRERLTDAPVILNYLDDESRRHFEAIQGCLTALDIPYVVDPRIVRGLDYYTGCVFEIHAEGIGAQSALCGGGRYDGLIEEIGGPPTPAVGVAMGIERALLALEVSGAAPAFEPLLHLFAVCLTERHAEFCKIVSQLRGQGIRVDTDLQFRSAKSQFRQADKSGASLALAIGDDELDSGTFKLKRLADGAEFTSTADTLYEDTLAYVSRS